MRYIDDSLKFERFAPKNDRPSDKKRKNLVDGRFTCNRKQRQQRRESKYAS